MTRRLRRTLLLGLAVALALVIVLRHNSARQETGMTRHALGATITLKSLKRLTPDVVGATIEITATEKQSLYPQLEPDGTSFGVNEECCGGDTQSDWRHNRLTYRISAHVKAPPGTQSLSVSQDFHFDRPGKKVCLKFRNVPIVTKPITLKNKGCKATLLAVYANKPVDPHRWQANVAAEPGKPLPSRFFAVIIESTIPNGTSTILDDGSFSDDKGHKCLPICIPPTGPTYGGPGLPPMSQNLIESVVGVFDSRRASEMFENRWKKVHNAAMATMPHYDIELYCVPALNPAPTKFNLTLRYVLPPEDKDKAHVVFRDVPIEE